MGQIATSLVIIAIPKGGKEPMNWPIEVLIVEHDPGIAENHRRFVEKMEGFEVIVTATTGQETIEWLKVIKPQLVLLNVYLPDMKGSELVDFIGGKYPHMDMIMITAASETDVVQKASRGSVVDFIIKPLTFDRVKSSLENYRMEFKQRSQAKQR